MRLAVIAAVIFALGAGCATLEARKRLQEYDDYFSPLIGKARQADIIRKLGEPVRRDRTGASELWYYHLPGTRGSQASGGFGGGYAVGADSEIYDDLTVEFDAKGYLKSWRGYIQR
jgi:outer membrane protein assembly factor BamE (lipoprotein component of BamABCDE complex)